MMPRWSFVARAQRLRYIGEVALAGLLLAAVLAAEGGRWSSVSVLCIIAIIGLRRGHSDDPAPAGRVGTALTWVGIALAVGALLVILAG